MPGPYPTLMLPEASTRRLLGRFRAGGGGGGGMAGIVTSVVTDREWRDIRSTSSCPSLPPPVRARDVGNGADLLGLAGCLDGLATDGVGGCLEFQLVTDRRLTMPDPPLRRLIPLREGRDADGPLPLREGRDAGPFPLREERDADGPLPPLGGVHRVGESGIRILVLPEL